MSIHSRWLNDLRWFWGYEVMDKGRTRLALWLTWRLPRRVVYWCAIRLFAHGTTGRYGHTVAPELTVMDALERWEDRSP
jgi:hypothetical protein